jgi:hypothetical protein
MSELIERHNEDKSENEKIYPTKYEGYYVNKIGEVYSTKRETVKRLNKFFRGKYLSVKLSNYNIKTQMYIHRLIAETFITNHNPAKYKYIDHINRDKNDNRVGNLRWCNQSQNNYNVKITKMNGKNCSSNYKGVCWDKRDSEWEVRLKRTKTDGRTIYRERFLNEIEAAKAYDIAVIKYRYKDLKYHILNFDIENYLDEIAKS